MSLLTDLDAFFTGHQRCGDLDAGVDGPIVLMTCTAAPASAGAWRRMTMPTRLPSDRLAANVAAAIGFVGCAADLEREGAS
jgi:hypothetical protein